MSAPHEFAIEGRCLAVSGHEDNYLDFIDGQRSLGITGLVPPDLVVDWSEATAFGRDENDDYAGWANARAEFKQRTGRELPPVLKVKITAEVVEASAEETAAYWAGVRARYREIPHA
jgi:hypothetical protein